jgi:hypothetical protein
MPVINGLDCFAWQPPPPQFWDSYFVLSSTGAPHFLSKQSLPKTTKPAQRRLASTPKSFQPPIANRLTPRRDLGSCKRINPSLHFCCQLSFICRSFTKLNSAEKYTARNHGGAAGFVAIPYFLPPTDHDSSPPEVHSFGFAARLLTIGL